MKNPIIDWEISKKLAGNNTHHAKEYLALLTKELSAQLESIRFDFKSDHYDNLQKQLHQLLGALSYCGATRLKEATKNLYLAIKHQNNNTLAFSHFETEANILIETVKQEINL